MRKFHEFTCSIAQVANLNLLSSFLSQMFVEAMQAWLYTRVAMQVIRRPEFNDLEGCPKTFANIVYKTSIHPLDLPSRSAILCFYYINKPTFFHSIATKLNAIR